MSICLQRSITVARGILRDLLVRHAFSCRPEQSTPVPVNVQNKALRLSAWQFEAGSSEHVSQRLLSVAGLARLPNPKKETAFAVSGHKCHGPPLTLRMVLAAVSTPSRTIGYVAATQIEIAVFRGSQRWPQHRFSTHETQPGHPQKLRCSMLIFLLAARFIVFAEYVFVMRQ